MKIKNVYAQEVLDSRGNPTVETAIELENGLKAKAMVPSGASTGVYEAVELRDGDKSRYFGKGVLKAVKNVNTVIADKVKSIDVVRQKEIDQAMIELDGTENKSKLGANAILSVSMAAARVAALEKKVPLYQHIAQLFHNSTNEYSMPIPMMNVLNGGKHAVGSFDMQEYMIMPVGAPNICEAVRWGSEVFHALGKILKKNGHQITVGDEGGYAPKLKSNEEPLQIIVEAIKKAGYKPGEEISIAQDPAASEFYKDGKYNLTVEDKRVSSEELTAIYLDWINKYPIISVEDGHGQDDWDGFTKMTSQIGDRVQIVGDDLLVTNVKRLKASIEKKSCNSILIKLNQIGTVSESIEAIQMAKKANMTSVVSHRSGETEDAFIADFVVGAGSGQIKTGSLSRSERISKYNRLMRIERELGDRAKILPMPYKG